MWLITAIFLHALFDGVSVIVSKLYNLYITEAVIFAMAAIIVVVTVMMYRNESNSDY